MMSVTQPGRTTVAAPEVTYSAQLRAMVDM